MINIKQNILIVVEGRDLEVNLVKTIAKKFLPNYKVVTKIYDKARKVDLSSYAVIESDESRVFIVKPKHNTLSAIIKHASTEEEFFIQQTYCNVDPDFFSLTFLIFDIDYTEHAYLKKAYKMFNDEFSTGLLLLSSPCAEALADFKNRKYKIKISEKIKQKYKPSVAEDLRLKRLIPKNKHNSSSFIKKYVFECCYYNLNKSKIKFLKDDYTKYQSDFIKLYLPTTKNGVKTYNFVISFLYVLIGLLDANPLKTISVDYLCDVLLKKSLNDSTSEKIIKLSNLLRKSKKIKTV